MCSRSSWGKVEVTAGPNPGDHRVGVATENNTIYMVDFVRGTLARVCACA